MSKPFFRNSAVPAIGILFLAAVSAFAAADRTDREPIVITSNHMEADKLGDTVVFSGNVVLKKEAMTLTADKLTVYYDEPDKNVREIDALGNVVVHKEGRVALAEKAVYYSAEEKIVLTGDPRIFENENSLGGERITLFMRDDRSIVEGGKVLLYQDRLDATRPQTDRKSGKAGGTTDERKTP